MAYQQTQQQPVAASPVYAQPPAYTPLAAGPGAQPAACAPAGGFKNTLKWFLIGFVFFPAFLVCSYRGFNQPDFFSRSLAVTSAIMGVILFLFFFGMCLPGAFYALVNALFIMSCSD